MPNNIKKARKLLSFSADSELAIFDELAEINDGLEEINKVFGDVKASELEKIKGDDGYTPVKNKDYFDGKNGSMIKKVFINEKGELIMQIDD